MALTVACRVCGKEYTPCKNSRYDPNVFNWKEVACSPECGAVYLERVIASRQPVSEEKPKRVPSKKKQIIVEEPTAEIICESDPTGASDDILAEE